MSDNIKRLKQFLLKHIEDVNTEIKEAEALAKEAKLSQAADTIKFAVRDQAFKNREKKSNAATMISKSYRTKMAIDKEYKSVGDYMCTDLGQKANYRIKILKLLEERGTPHIIKNLYLYYCRFGAKSLGFEKPSGSNKGYLIKKIQNSIFVNTGFKSTNFSTIHFTLCKFLQGRAGDKYMNLLGRKKELISAKKKGTYDTMEFDNTKLENCLFEECDFFGVRFKNLNVGSIIRDNGFERTVEATRFFKCNFKIGTEFKYPNSKQQAIGLLDTKYDMYFNNVGEIVGRVAHNKNVINISRTEVKISPRLIFEDCKFDSFVFMSQDTQVRSATNSTLFLNCEFKGEFNKNSFEKLVFNEVKFINCKFENISFSRINFNKFKFEDCELINCKFEMCLFIGICCIIDNTKLKETQFIQCVFSSHAVITTSCIITNNCILNEVSFIYCELTNFVFNYQSVQEGSKIMLIMKNCHFICNNLFGTNFDYCDLEKGDFAERVNCIEQINWLGSVVAKMSYPKMLKGDIKEINIGSDGDILHDKFGVNENEMILLEVPRKKGVYQLKNRDYINKGYRNAEDFITSKNINAWDYFEIYNGTFLYFIPPTSFNEANIQTCRFQGLDGFESFDFTKIKYKDGKPNLNAVNFTNVDLTNANMTNCNLIGTVFQVAKVTGVDFKDTVTNENTDFQNTIDIGLALNAEHINFGELQNNANETHTRSQFIINNRNKYKDFYAQCQDPVRLESLLLGDNVMSKAKKMYEKIIRIIKSPEILTSTWISNLKTTFDKFIIMLLIKKVDYSKAQLRKLKTDFESIISDEFINILTKQQGALQGGEEGTWCWLELVLDSLLFLFHCPSTYIFNFFEFYFYDVFNAHGVGGKSCTLGMVERLVTIHTQVCEKFIMSMDVEPTPTNVDILRHYNEGNPNAVDDEITIEFIEKFNDPNKLISPNDCKVQLHKYTLNKFLNLLKPNSKLPEEGSKDFGIVFDKTIKPEWRDEFQDAAKVEVNESRVQNLDSLCDYFVLWMKEKILQENGYPVDVVDSLTVIGGDKFENLLEKLNELEDFLIENEIPNLKMAIIIMTSEEVTYEELIEYFAGGGKRKSYKKKAKGLIQKAKSFSLKKMKSLSSKKINSAPAKFNPSKLDKLDSLIVQKFVMLSKEKVSKIFKEFYHPTVKFFSKKMSIEDREYREILEKRVKRMKMNNNKLLKDNHALNNYKTIMKEIFSKVSKSQEKTSPTPESHDFLNDYKTIMKEIFSKVSTPLESRNHTRKPNLVTRLLTRRSQKPHSLTSRSRKLNPVSRLLTRRSQKSHSLTRLLTRNSRKPKSLTHRSRKHNRVSDLFTRRPTRRHLRRRNSPIPKKSKREKTEQSFKLIEIDRN